MIKPVFTYKTVLLVLLLLVLNACYYKPFVGYLTHKKGFKHFNNKEKLAGNNSNPHRDYHVNRYDWDLEIFPEQKKIEGKMEITFTSDSKQQSFLFDLQKRMKIKDFSTSVGNPQIKRKGDLFYLNFDQPIASNTRIKLTIYYSGKPANVIGEGPIQWKHDTQDRPWISTATEGIGPQFILPCDALLRDEADSCTINITVPSDLVAVANGRLKSVVDSKTGNSKTYRYAVTNPINIYNISFNVGHFVKLLKPYTALHGIERQIECQVLDYHREIADTFYNQAPRVMKTYETLFGEFPWWNDGCKFIESTYGAMEHQSGIALGDDYTYDWKDYNLTLVHELAHEWWGNNITAYDYCDAWMHEGLATYAEALFIEKEYGKEEYYRKIKEMIYDTYNKIPIKKVCGVLYNSWGNDEDQDIYDKGALMMHSLRVVVNDDTLFFHAMKQIQQDFARRNVNSDQWITKFNELLGNDYTALFDWYLNKRKPPVLQIYVDKENRQLFYKWEEDVPFYKEGEVLINTGNDTVKIKPTATYQSIDINGIKSLNFVIEKTIYFVV